jgi:tetratricopeptide (TPR) repeat protein
VGLARWRWRPPIAITVTVVVLAALTVRTARQNLHWRNPLRLFGHTRQAAPESVRAHSNLGLANLIAGRREEALAELLEAERLDPSDLLVKANLSVVYESLGDRDQATRKLAECLALDPRRVGTLLRIARLYDDQCNIKRARYHLMVALALDNSVYPRIQFVEFLLKHHRPHEAMRVGRQAVQLDPASADAWNLLGVCLAELGQKEEARRAFQIAAGLDRHDDRARRNLTRLQHQANAMTVVRH